MRLFSFLLVLMLSITQVAAQTGSGFGGGGVSNVSSGSVTGTLPVANGGTNATTAADARTSLSAAKSGANSDITSLSGLTTPLSEGQGGTGTPEFNLNSAIKDGRFGTVFAQTGSTTLISFGHLNTFSATGTTAASADAEGNFVQYTSAASTGTNNGWVASGDGNDVIPTTRQWSPEGTFVFKTGADLTNVRYLVGFTAQPATSIASAGAGGNNSNDIFGLSYDSAVDGTAFWRLTHDSGSDGGAATRSATTIPIAASTYYVFRFKLGASTCEVYNDTAGRAATATASASSNLPDAATVLSAFMGNRTLANEAEVIKCGKIFVISK
jgi:hypothetical protein